MAVIDNRTLRGLLPHSANMCLLDTVRDWDSQQIHCVAETHLKPDNPLAVEGILPVEAGIEYAAQAMAVHGYLSRQKSGVPKVGYLAVLSRVQWRVQRLDDLPGPLQVSAELLVATAEGSHYQFSLEHNGAEILSGQAVVALAQSGDQPG